MTEQEKLEICCEWLNNNGYSNARAEKHPTDIIACKDGHQVYIEVKSTGKEHECFGAATFTAWIVDGELYFLIFRETCRDDSKKFALIPAEKFYNYSTIPPLKVNFNIDLDNLSKHTNHPRAVPMTEDNAYILSKVYNILKDQRNKQDLKNFLLEMEKSGRTIS